MTAHELEGIAAAAKLFHQLGASEVYLFGSAVTGELRPGSDVDMAVTGLPPKVYFSAVSQATELVGRPIDLIDLDDQSALVRYLRTSGDLVRVS